MRETARGFANRIGVTVPGRHFIQEESGAEIGKMFMVRVKITD